MSIYSDYPAVDVLAIGAHPDDVELGCGGTLIKLRNRGLRTAVLDLTRGELGSRGSAEVRAQEARQAARILGLEFRANLELEDGDIRSDAESRLRLICFLRQCRPSLVITHSRGGHPDHGKSVTLVEEAVHHSGLSKIDTGQERFRPDKVAFWLTFSQTELPQVIVDISDVYSEKEEAIRSFASQLHIPGSQEPETYLSRPTFLEQIRSFHTHLGSLAGCMQGEGFLLSRFPRLYDLTEC